MPRKRLLTLLLGLVLALAGCDRPNEAQPAHSALPAVRVNDPAVLTRGQELFRAHCARCHGASGEGAPDWHKPNAQGKYPAPPLDASGHAWHHPRIALRSVIKGGTLNMGGDMPAWRDKLTDAEIDAIIAWFQSTWPQEIFSAWQELDAQSQAPGAR